MFWMDIARDMPPIHSPDHMISNRAHGVTLVELVVVIAITGIIGAVVAVFIRRPVEGYIDASRRAALTDQADTALRRITRDLRVALPNSVRVNGQFIEYIETTGGGRYRTETGTGGSGNNILDFTQADANGFDVLGPVPAFTAGPGGSQIVVFNLFNTGTVSNAYFTGANSNRAALTGIGTIPIEAKLFPEPSPARRFHVVSGPVTYGCVGNQLIRYSGYGYNEPQVAPPVGGTAAVLTGNVAACQFVYTAGALSERTATVAMVLQLTGAGGTESVRLFQQAQVSNAP